MSSTLVFCIVATAFVLIQCEFKYTACSPVVDDHPHPFEVETCTRKKFHSLINDHFMETFPAPQALEKFVKLAGNYRYNPSMVIVKRCDGQCDGELTLQAVGTANRTFVAFQSEDGGLPKCVSVIVEEHTKCACTCLKKETACRNPQMLFHETCTCECPDEYEDAKNDCEDDDRGIKYWNSTTCSCECNESSTKKKCLSNSGDMWNAETCRCNRRRN